MQFTGEVDWTAFDFVFVGVLILGTGVAFEIAVRKTKDTAYRAAVGVALTAAFLLVWINGAVGIIGPAGNDANLMFAGVLAVGIIGSFIARFQPQRMAGAMFATASAQTLVALIAIVAGLGAPASGPMELLFLNGFFVTLWVGSAWLFRKAARG